MAPPERFAVWLTAHEHKDPRLQISRHKQPHAAERMVAHVRGLPIRQSAGTP